MYTSDERQLPRSPASVPEARTFVIEALDRWRLDDRLDDVQLCASELATNAVQHGVPPGRCFLVRIILHDHLLRIEVHDSGSGTPGVRRPDTDVASGRGLFLVDSLADSWGVSPRQGPGKAVWAEFKLTQVAEASFAARERGGRR